MEECLNLDELITDDFLMNHDDPQQPQHVLSSSPPSAPSASQLHLTHLRDTKWPGLSSLTSSTDSLAFHQLLSSDPDETLLMNADQEDLSIQLLSAEMPPENPSFESTTTLHADVVSSLAHSLSLVDNRLDDTENKVVPQLLALKVPVMEERMIVQENTQLEENDILDLSQKCEECPAEFSNETFAEGNIEVNESVPITEESKPGITVDELIPQPKSVLDHFTMDSPNTSPVRVSVASPSHKDGAANRLVERPRPTLERPLNFANNQVDPVLTGRGPASPPPLMQNVVSDPSSPGPTGGLRRVPSRLRSPSKPKSVFKAMSPVTSHLQPESTKEVPPQMTDSYRPRLAFIKEKMHSVTSKITSPLRTTSSSGLKGNLSQEPILIAKQDVRSPDLPSIVKSEDQNGRGIEDLPRTLNSLVDMDLPKAPLSFGSSLRRTQTMTPASSSAINWNKSSKLPKLTQWLNTHSAQPKAQKKTEPTVQSNLPVPRLHRSQSIHFKDDVTLKKSVDTNSTENSRLQWRLFRSKASSTSIPGSPTQRRPPLNSLPTSPSTFSRRQI